MRINQTGKLRWLFACGFGFTLGCAGQRVNLPAGHMPVGTEPIDFATAMELTKTRGSGVSGTQRQLEMAPLPKPIPDTEKQPDLPLLRDDRPAPGRDAFQLAPGLPGSESSLMKPFALQKDHSLADRQKAVNDAYPKLIPVEMPRIQAEGQPLSLADLEKVAFDYSPVLQKAQMDVEVTFNKTLQAGLYPNPTIGYQVDQWQPGLKIPAGVSAGNQGQQGGYVNQLIKTVGKVRLAQLVAGYDYINALVAVRKAHVNVAAQVRAAYFQAIVAQKTLEVNKSLTEMTDQVYQLQLKQVIAGIAAGYEPLQLYAQAVQARNAFAQAEASYKAAWKKLAAAVGQPDMQPVRLLGHADAPVPKFEQASTRVRIADQHTEILTVRNNIAQHETNLTLQKRLPVPDLQTNTYQQYDNFAQAYQFGLQIGIEVPIANRNQGNIRATQAAIASSKQQLLATEFDLYGQLGEAFGRYEAFSVQVENYRKNILPTLEQAYQLIVRRFQAEPEKVSFNDIVVAQNNLAQALQTYLSFLDSQWKAVVEIAQLGQYDELYPDPPTDLPAVPMIP